LQFEIVLVWFLFCFANTYANTDSIDHANTYFISCAYVYSILYANTHVNTHANIYTDNYSINCAYTNANTLMLILMLLFY